MYFRKYHACEFVATSIVARLCSRATRSTVTILAHDLRNRAARVGSPGREVSRRVSLLAMGGMRRGPHRDFVFRPPRRASAVVVGISMGRNRARDARDPQLFLADDQRARLLR